MAVAPFLLGLLFLLSLRETVLAGTADYCPFETFEANCEQPGEVIVMQRARYGRMQIGRCLQTDFGYVGCAVDVLPFADMRCSGKRTCAVDVPNQYLDETNRPCPEDLEVYLEAGYTCISVIRPQLAKCEDRGPVEVEGTTGVLSSAITRETGCGSTTTPWVIRAGPGQRISFRLTDFGWLGQNQTGGSIQVHQHCQVYAIIKDGLAGRTSTICGGHSSQSRERHVYMSVENYVEVRILVWKNTDAADFLLSFEATD